MSNGPVVRFAWYQRAQHVCVRHRSMDLVIALILGGLWVAAAHLHWVPYGLTLVPADARKAVYQVLAAGAATMGGFTLTSISILVNLLRTPMTTVDKLLPADDKRRVGSVFLAVLPWLLALFVAAVVCLTMDSTICAGYWWMHVLVAGVIVGTVCSIARVIWVLRRLLAVSTD